MLRRLGRTVLGSFSSKKGVKAEVRAASAVAAAAWQSNQLRVHGVNNRPWKEERHAQEPQACAWWQRLQATQQAHWQSCADDQPKATSFGSRASSISCGSELPFDRSSSSSASSEAGSDKDTGSEASEDLGDSPWEVDDLLVNVGEQDNKDGPLPWAKPVNKTAKSKAAIMRAAALASRAAEVASRSSTYQPWSAGDKAAAMQLAQQVQAARHAAARAAMDAHMQDVQALEGMSQQQRDARAHQEWQRAGATDAEKAQAQQQAAQMAAAVAEQKALLLQAGLDGKEAAKQAAKAAAKQVEQREWAAWEQELQELAADPTTAHVAARIRADMDAAAKAQVAESLESLQEAG